MEVIQTDLATDSVAGGAIDATETIVVYEKGKTWDCPECDHGIGTLKEVPMVKCASCHEVLVDKKWEMRDEPTEQNQTRQATLFESTEDDEQSALNQFTEL